MSKTETDEHRVADETVHPTHEDNAPEEVETGGDAREDGREEDGSAGDQPEEGAEEGREDEPDPGNDPDDDPTHA